MLKSYTVCRSMPRAGPLWKQSHLLLDGSYKIKGKEIQRSFPDENGEECCNSHVFRSSIQNFYGYFTPHILTMWTECLFSEQFNSFVTNLFYVVEYNAEQIFRCCTFFGTGIRSKSFNSNGDCTIKLQKPIFTHVNIADIAHSIINSWTWNEQIQYILQFSGKLISG